MSGDVVSIEDYTPRAQSAKTCDIAIIGAGPVGLFAVFQAGLLGLKCILVDALERPGGQCAELYPEKPIYDIPAYPVISGQELTDRLMQQIAPFEPEFLYSQQVASLTRTDNGSFELVTTQGVSITAPTVFIAAGAGSFVPRKPKVENLAAYEEKSFFYAVRNRQNFVNRDVVVFGGGDSALDWTLDLLPQVKSLTLVHRRDKFRATPASIDAMRKAVEDKRMRLVFGQLDGLSGSNGELDKISVKTSDGTSIDIKADRALAFFGLNIELGPIAEWGLNLNSKLIEVDTEKFETSTPGIFAIGDINWYPGKLKLILSGFHESALATQAAFKIARPDEKLVFRYTTSSSDLQQKLGVA
jgi:thioredoxin reductase (NADPH)